MEKVVYNYLTDKPRRIHDMEIPRVNKIRITFREGSLRYLYPNGLVGYYREVNSSEEHIGISISVYSLLRYNLDRKKDRELISGYANHGFNVWDIERIAEIIPPTGDAALHYWISENNSKNFYDRK